MTENNEGLEKASQVDLSRNLKDKGSAKQEDEIFQQRKQLVCQHSGDLGVPRH